MRYITKQKFTVAIALVVGAGLFVPSARADKHDKEETAVEGNSQAAEPMVTKVIPVQHVDPEEVVSLFFRHGARLDFSSELGVITVYGTAASVDSLEEAIRAVDVPGVAAGAASANAAITGYLLAAIDEVSSSGKLPSVLEPVVRELREAFPYPGYRLLETFTLRVRHRPPGGGAEVSGVISHSSVNGHPIYVFKVATGPISSVGNRRVIPLDSISLHVQWPHVRNPEFPDQFMYMNAQISTGVTIEDGRTVVIGKAGVPGKNRGLFLIIKARVAE